MTSEPEGTTPLDPDEAAALIPDHVATRAELDAWEQANIVQAVDWLARRRGGTVVSLDFVRELHRRMFDRTWSWAGRFRTTAKNIGVPAHAIAEELRNLLDDVRYWVTHATYVPDEVAARFHHRLVQTHPFVNGNGRHGRLMADALMVELAAPPLTWGSGRLDHDGAVRARYLEVLRQADRGDVRPLLDFIRT